MTDGVEAPRDAAAVVVEGGAPEALPGSAKEIAVSPGARARVPVVVGNLRRGGILLILRQALALGRTRLGLVLLGLIVCVALVGPLVAPHPSTSFVAPPFTKPSAAFPLGSDYLGRDVLSRYLDGGLVILIEAVLATLIGVGLGTACGLAAGYVGGAVDDVIMRSMDVVLSFPAIVLALVLMSVVGPKAWILVLAVGVTHMPQTARVVRGATLQQVGREFIRYAEGLGIGRGKILRGELLPNISGTLMVEFGLRLTYSIGLVASLAFLGFGRQPPAADWGLMINENRIGLTVQPWAVVAPVIAIALVTIGANLVTDGVARAAAGINRVVDVSEDS